MSSYAVSLSAQGVSAPRPVMQQKPFWAGIGGVGLIVNFSGTTDPATGAASGVAAVATATVQISSDPLAIDKPDSAKWVAHPVLSGITADAAAAQEFACVAVRLVLTAWTSGTVQLQMCSISNT